MPTILWESWGGWGLRIYALTRTRFVSTFLFCFHFFVSIMGRVRICALTRKIKVLWSKFMRVFLPLPTLSHLIFRGRIIKQTSTSAVCPLTKYILKTLFGRREWWKCAIFISLPKVYLHLLGDNRPNYLPNRLDKNGWYLFNGWRWSWQRREGEFTGGLPPPP